jgi:hypothetical protein
MLLKLTKSRSRSLTCFNWFMDSVVLCERDSLKIFNSIVGAIFVFMVNVFGSKKRSTKIGLHNSSMLGFKVPISRHSNVDIAVLPSVDANLFRNAGTRTPEFSNFVCTNKQFPAFVTLSRKKFLPVSVKAWHPIPENMLLNFLLPPQTVIAFYESLLNSLVNCHAWSPLNGF